MLTISLNQKLLPNLKTWLLFLAISLCTVVNTQPIAENIHRVLFLGNSITYAGSYITDIEAYYKVHYPERQIEFINAGLPSETVSGLSEEGHAGGRFPRPDLHERLERLLALTKPDLVFACYGMNDGIYLPLDRERFAKFKQGINWLHETLAKTSARIIHLTPPVFDELKGKKAGYAAVLDTYADRLLRQRKTAKWEVADCHFPMKEYLEAHQKVDAVFGLDGFALASDGVHPDELGHWIIAREILLYLGEKEVAKKPTINAALVISPKGEQVLKLVSQRQMMMKDAWLSAAGHKRPDMKTGLSLVEAKLKAKTIEIQIADLVTISK